VVGDPVNSDFMDAPRGVHTLICPPFFITGREDANRLLEFRQRTEGGNQVSLAHWIHQHLGELAEAIPKTLPTGKDWNTHSEEYALA
jgi:hypothetical protein